MRSLSAILAFLLCLAPASLAGQPAPIVVNPHISTDKSVDTSTVDRILHSLVREDMTDEQKVLAVFHWIRRVLYHGDGPDDLAYDFGVMVHCLGNGSCLRQTSPLAMLLGRLGCESRSWVHDGHHMLEVKYGGKWHCLDPHMTFYVYDRSDPPTIASVEQLRADATLAADAVKERRACPGYLLCGDSPGVFGPGGEWVNDRFPKLKINEPFGQITLRRGETYTRTWMPGDEAYRFRRSWQFDYGPYHTCTVKGDQKDVVNWPLYEPHVAAVGADAKYKAARHWAIGQLVYKPDLRTDHYKDAVVRAENVRHDGEKGLTLIDAEKPGLVVFSVRCPYVLTGGKMTLQTKGPGRITAGWSKPAGQAGPPLPMRLPMGQLTIALPDEINGAFEGYDLHLKLEGDVSIESLELITRFQLNPYSLPYLVPGKNVVKLEADRLASPLQVEWTYAEGPDWKTDKTAAKTFTAGGTFTIDVKGDKYPRNIALVLSVAP